VVVVDTERHLGLNRAIALRLLRRRIEDGDEVAGRAVTTARWRIHDELVRGNPTRTERPDATAPGPANRGIRGRAQGPDVRRPPVVAPMRVGTPRSPDFP
jgi:hypothetical protein